jgi:hypothetical protein
LPGPSSGPVMYPSIDVVIPAMTLVIGSHLLRSRKSYAPTDRRRGGN